VLRGNPRRAARHLDVAAVGLCGAETAASALVGALAALVSAECARDPVIHSRKLDEAMALLDRAVKRAEQERDRCDASSPDSSS
jgi:hypothetical protein